MEDDTTIENFCTNLVSAKLFEPFIVQMFSDVRAGEWVGVVELCIRLGLSTEGIEPDLCATYLADPLASEDYVLIVFCDTETMWSMAARYNRQRLARTPAGEKVAAAARM